VLGNFPGYPSTNVNIPLFGCTSLVELLIPKKEMGGSRSPLYMLQLTIDAFTAQESSSSPAPPLLKLDITPSEFVLFKGFLKSAAERKRQILFHFFPALRLI
jgi:hypothetical protein